MNHKAFQSWILLFQFSTVESFVTIQASRKTTNPESTLFAADSVINRGTHIVEGVCCQEVHMDVPGVGIVVVLEATAESQADLVDMALALEEENSEKQLLSAGDPYGAVLWPAAWAVAKYIINDKKLPLQELSLLELGTGTGLVSISAAIHGAKQVIATDYEPLALKLTTYAAENFHSISEDNLKTEILDMCKLDQPLPVTDILVAADIMYEPKTGVAMAHRAIEALRNNSRVIVGDSPGRPGRPAFLKTLKELGLGDAEFIDTIGRTCTGPRHELICGAKSTSVSQTPKDLSVAIMDLTPSMLES